MSYSPTNKSANISLVVRLGSNVISLLSVVTIGIALMSGVWFASSIIIFRVNNTAEPDTLFDTLVEMVVIGLVYLVGLILGSVGIRTLKNVWLPVFIHAYDWLVLAGIILLQILIILRLYNQDYNFSSYVKYLFLFGTGLIALVGLHLVLERHRLIFSGVFILFASLVHLYFMVFRYIFSAACESVKIFGDLGFLIVTTVVGVMMVSVYKIPTETEAP